MSNPKPGWYSKLAMPAAAPSVRPKPGFPAKMPGMAGAVDQKKTAPGAAEKNQVIAYSSPFVPSVGVGQDSAAFRTAMVNRLRSQGIDHDAVLQAMNEVERHRFVDSALGNQAYEETSLPIGLGQTISKPSVVARMLALLCHNQALPMRRVLEIGTGCGYQAAVLSRLCVEVYSMERLKGLNERAQTLLRPFRIPNVHLLLGDGMLGFPSGAPYAGIIAAAGGDAIPSAWTDQLAVGGRLVAPTRLGQSTQSLVVIDKTPTGLVQTVLEAVQFVPLKSGIG